MRLKRVSSLAMQTLAVISLALPLTSGTWAAPKYKVLHAFGTGNDGAGLYGGLVFDQRGNLYGGTNGGGDYGYGTVFQLIPGRGGEWSEHVMRSFKFQRPERRRNRRHPNG